MAEGGYPSVYVVDSYSTRPAVPPRLSRGQQRSRVAQTLLFLLVSLALVGMTIEACLIYRLYQPKSGSSASYSKHTGGNDVSSLDQSHRVRPSKPVAHLTDGQDVTHGNQTMAWSTIADPLLYKMTYRDGYLFIQKEGYYYVYSKVSFFDRKMFHHSIERKTPRYNGKSIPLLQSRKYSKASTYMQNSYLGGVFLLRKDDAIFVKVSNTSCILRNRSYENIFGAYMI